MSDFQLNNSAFDDFVLSEDAVSPKSKISDEEDEEIHFKSSIYEDSAAELKFRSISVLAEPPSNHVFSDFHHASESLELNISKSAFQKNALIPEVGLVVESKNSMKCPSVPMFGLVSTNFKMDSSDFDLNVTAVDQALAQFKDFDFSTFNEDCMWKGKYLKGSCCFELEINLFFDEINNTYTLAVNKVKSGGNHPSFRDFFEELRAKLVAGAVARKARVLPNLSASLVPGMKQLTELEFVNGIQPVFRMCQEPVLESRIEGVKMLCDVAQKDQKYLVIPAFVSSCVEALESLLQDPSEDVRQYAVMAASLYVELEPYAKAYLTSSVLPVMFSLVENSADPSVAYETACVRRTAAEIVALLSRCHPYTVRIELEKASCDVAAWIDRASTLIDERTREYALTITDSIRDVSIPNLYMSAVPEMGSLSLSDDDDILAGIAQY